MVSYKYEYNQELTDEKKRLICFAADVIDSFKCENNYIVLNFKSDIDDKTLDTVKCNLDKLLINSVEVVNEQDIIYSNDTKMAYHSDDEIIASELITRYENGLVVLAEPVIRLISFFDDYFKGILSEYEYTEKHFPTLLPTDVIADTSYFDSSPQYIMFCENVKESLNIYNDLRKNYEKNNYDEILDSPRFTLSPSACFHLFGAIRNMVFEEEKIFTHKQNVFRNEGRLNWGKLTRLNDYTVREIVFIGDNKYVCDIREKLMKKTAELMNKLGMTYQIVNASDPFIVPTMNIYKMIQKKNHLKYELRVNTSENDTVSCASFNIHGSAFSKNFKFKVNNITFTESGCIGFGLERLAIAFLNQFGCDINNWPEIIKKELEKRS